MEVLLGLGFVGMLLNNNGEQSHKNINDGKNYKESTLKHERKKLQKKAADRIYASKHTDNTHIIPKFYNQPEDKRPHFDDDGISKQFEELKFDNSSNPVSYSNPSSLNKEIEQKRELDAGYSKYEPDTDMRYGVTNDMSHNNMTPFFGSRKGYGYDEGKEEKLNYNSQRKIDLFSGSINNPEYKHKEEVKPFFSPLMGFTDIYGQQVMSDFYQDRFVPGRERRNEFPVQQIRVTPGLNLGYNEVGYQGYFDPYRPKMPTVDDLRSLDKPKKTYMGVVIPGLMGERAPIGSKVVKNRPERFKELDTTDVYPVVNQNGAQPIFGYIDPTNLGTVNRGVKELLHLGGMGMTSQNTPSNLRSKVHEPSREVYDGAAPIMGMITSLHNHPNNQEARATSRQVYEESNYVGFSGDPYHPYLHPSDEAKDTIKSTTENLDHVGFSGDPYHPYIHPSDEAKDTIKSTTENLDHVGFSGDPYHPYVHPSDKAKDTIKSTTENLDYVKFSGDPYHPYVHPSDKAKDTIKSTTENLDHVGIINKTNSSYVHPSDKAKKTIKSLTENLDHLGIINKSDQTYVHPSDKAKNTIKSTTENLDHVGNIGKSNKQYVHPSDKARMTTRTVYENNKYVNAPKDMDLPKSRMDAEHMKTNNVKEKVAKGRYPTQCNYERGPVTDFTNFRLVNNALLGRKPAPNAEQMTTLKLPTNYTRWCSTLNPTNYNPEENLFTNPFTSYTKS